MTNAQLRKEQGYIEAKEKILSYPKGFQFTMKYNEIPQAKCNALKVLLRDCCDEKIIDSISFGVSLQGEIADETFIKL